MDVPNFSLFLQQMSNGIALGSIYALIALGYTMVYGIVKLINFAHGDVLMIGAFASYYALRWFGTGIGGLLAAAAFSVFVCVTLVIIIERLAYKPLRNAPRINALITAIGISFILENGARVIPFMGPNPREFPTVKLVNIELGAFSVSNIQLIVLATAVVFMVILTFIVSSTKMGKAMRAVAFDMKAAALMGIPVDFVISFTFALGAALAAIGGLLFALSYPQVEPYMGIMPGLKAFIAAVFGGIGSIPGAVLGGYVLGIVETLSKGYISSQLSDAVVFGILILILIVKPAGLLGKFSREKV
jgi:branched-chain amino acid transport system permease protein